MKTEEKLIDDYARASAERAWRRLDPQVKIDWDEMRVNGLPIELIDGFYTVDNSVWSKK